MLYPLPRKLQNLTPKMKMAHRKVLVSILPNSFFSNMDLDTIKKNKTQNKGTNRGVQKNKIFEFELALCIFPLE